MDRARYRGEGMRQLADGRVYVSLETDPTADMIKKINERVHKACLHGHISESTLEYFMINSNVKAGRFYLLPKLHKEDCPGKPTISRCNMPTEKISEFIDYHLKPLATAIPSDVKDTNDSLKKFQDIGTLPENAILVTGLKRLGRLSEGEVISKYPQI